MTRIQHAGDAMLQDTLKRLEARLAEADLSDEQRDTLLGLVDQLRVDLGTVPATSTPTPAPEEAGLLDELDTLARNFEEEHPTVAAALNAVAVSLSNLGL